LESNSRIAKYSLINGSYSFSKSEFVPALTDQSINLTDPDFWSKVLKNIDTRSQSLLKEYDKGNSSATSESQTCFMHEISLCVKDLIESKLTLTGFNSEDEKCLS
jgi:chromodomain-helicase-DNA-binding protein 7